MRKYAAVFECGSLQHNTFLVYPLPWNFLYGMPFCTYTTWLLSFQWLDIWNASFSLLLSKEGKRSHCVPETQPVLLEPIRHCDTKEQWELFNTEIWGLYNQGTGTPLFSFYFNFLNKHKLMTVFPAEKRNSRPTQSSKVCKKFCNEESRDKERNELLWLYVSC